MAIRVANAQLWVHDQEEALDFWTNKVGFEVRADISMPEGSATSAGSRSERPVRRTSRSPCLPFQARR